MFFSRRRNINPRFYAGGDGAPNPAVDQELIAELEAQIATMMTPNEGGVGRLLVVDTGHKKCICGISLKEHIRLKEHVEDMQRHGCW